MPRTTRGRNPTAVQEKQVKKAKKKQEKAAKEQEKAAKDENGNGNGNGKNIQAKKPQALKEDVGAYTIKQLTEKAALHIPEQVNLKSSAITPGAYTLAEFLQQYHYKEEGGNIKPGDALVRGYWAWRLYNELREIHNKGDDVFRILDACNKYYDRISEEDMWVDVSQQRGDLLALQQALEDEFVKAALEIEAVFHSQKTGNADIRAVQNNIKKLYDKENGAKGLPSARAQNTSKFLEAVEIISPPSYGTAKEVMQKSTDPSKVAQAQKTINKFADNLQRQRSIISARPKAYNEFLKKLADSYTESGENAKNTTRYLSLSRFQELADRCIVVDQHLRETIKAIQRERFVKLLRIMESAQNSATFQAALKEYDEDQASNVEVNSVEMNYGGKPKSKVPPPPPHKPNAVMTPIPFTYPTQYIPIRRGLLKKHGYGDVKNKTERARHIALGKAVKEYGPMSTYWKLDAVYRLNRDIRPKIGNIFLADRNYIKKKYKVFKSK